MPEDANNKGVNYESLDLGIAIVDNLGNVLAISEGATQIIVKTQENNIQKIVNITVTKKVDESKLSFASYLNVNQGEITGLLPGNTTVEKIKQDITTIYDIEVCNYKNEILTDDKLIGTGSKIKIKEEGNLMFEYVVIIYGDVNGDGRINSIDLLTLQRHILKISIFDGSFLKAGNINKNGNRPTSVDLLLIQRHILKINQITQ